MRFYARNIKHYRAMDIITYLGTLFMFTKMKTYFHNIKEPMLNIIYKLIQIRFGYSMGNRIIKCLKQDKTSHNMPSVLYQCGIYILACNRINLIYDLIENNPHTTSKNIKFLNSLKIPKVDFRNYSFDSSIYFVFLIEALIEKNDETSKIHRMNQLHDVYSDYKHIKSYKSYAKKKSNKLEKQRHMIVVRNKQEVKREHIKFHKQQRKEQLKQKKFDKKPLWEKQTIKSWRKFAHGVHIVFWGY